MNQNTSWLRKGEIGNFIGTNRRSIMIQSAVDNNASITLNTSESARAYKPLPRKSCIMNTDRSKIVPAQQQKSRIAIRGRLPSTMVKSIAPRKSQGQPASGRTSMGLQSRLLPRRRAAIEKLLPQWAEEKVQAMTPLHMSTPRDPVRSILKQRRPNASSTNTHPNVAKKVIFDNVSEPPPPLEESTLASFLPLTDLDTAPAEQPTSLVEPKNNDTESRSTADAATNTDLPFPDDKAEDSVIFQLCARKMNEFTRKLTDILTEMRDFQRTYKLDGVRPMFESNLDEIQEMSENVTPSISGTRSSTITPLPTDNSTPAIGISETVEKQTISKDLISVVEVAELGKKLPSSLENPNEPLLDMHLSPRKKSRNSAQPAENTLLISFSPRKKSPRGKSSPLKKSGISEHVSPLQPSPKIETHTMLPSPSKTLRVLVESIPLSPSKNSSPISERQKIILSVSPDAGLTVNKSDEIACDEGGSEKENVGPEKVETVGVVSPCLTRRSSRLRGHLSPAAPILAMSRRSKHIKRNISSLIRFSDAAINEVKEGNSDV